VGHAAASTRRQRPTAQSSPMHACREHMERGVCGGVLAAIHHSWATNRRLAVRRLGEPAHVICSGGVWRSHLCAVALGRLQGGPYAAA
jgi:hypothetical protein